MAVKRSRVALLARKFGAGELARRVGVSGSTVRRWVREGTPYARHEELRSVERRSEAARYAATVRIERVRAEREPPRPKRRSPVRRPAPTGVPLTAREREQLEVQRELAREEVERLRQKRYRPVEPGDLQDLRHALEEEIDTVTEEWTEEDEDIERQAIEEEQILDESEGPAPPEDVYPLPSRRMEFFEEHDRTDLEGVTEIHWDEKTGRILGTNDQGETVAAYLFTNEDGQPKAGPDSLRWALAKDLEDYVAHVNKVLRERYGDSTMRGAFGRFHLPERKAA
jgi:hypothetical protein